MIFIYIYSHIYIYIYIYSTSKKFHRLPSTSEWTEFYPIQSLPFRKRNIQHFQEADVPGTVKPNTSGGNIVENAGKISSRMVSNRDTYVPTRSARICKNTNTVAWPWVKN